MVDQDNVREDRKDGEKQSFPTSLKVLAVGNIAYGLYKLWRVAPAFLYQYITVNSFIISGGFITLAITFLLLSSGLKMLKRNRVWGYWGGNFAGALILYDILILEPVFMGDFRYFNSFGKHLDFWFFLSFFLNFLYPAALLYFLKANKSFFVEKKGNMIWPVLLVVLVVLDSFLFLFPTQIAWVLMGLGILIVIDTFGPAQATGYGRTQKEAYTDAEIRLEGTKNVRAIGTLAGVALLLIGAYVREQVAPARLEDRQYRKDKEEMAKKFPLIYYLKYSTNPEVKEIQKFLDSGIDVNAQTKNGETAFDAVVWRKNNVDLIRLLIDRGANIKMRYTVAETLVKIGPPAIPSLVKALVADDSSTRKDAAAVLEKIDPHWASTEQTRKAIPVLVKALTNQDFSVRQAAAEALGKIGPPAKEAIPALKKALSDLMYSVRGAATEALKRIGAEKSEK